MTTPESDTPLAAGARAAWLVPPVAVALTWGAGLFALLLELNYVLKGGVVAAQSGPAYLNHHSPVQFIAQCHPLLVIRLYMKLLLVF